MKKRVKIILTALCLIASTTLTSKAQSLFDLVSSSTVQDVVSSVISDIIPVTSSQISGTWSYSGSACSFESDNLLSQAGGAVAASTINTKLTAIYSKLGLSSSKLNYTFSTDGNFSNSILGQSLSGTYTLDDDAITLSYKAVSTIDMFSISGKVAVSGSSLYLYFEASKLLELLSKVTSSVASLNTITSLADSYDGLLLGFELTK